MQNGVHGTAAIRLGLISSSQWTQVPNVPSSMRRSAARTLRRRFDSRSRLRIASSRSAAFWTSSRASGLFSIVIPSRFRSTSTSSACLVSRISLYLFTSLFVMAASPYYCFFVSLCPSFQYGIDVELLSKLQNLPENKWVEIALRDGIAVGVSDNLRDLAPRIIAHRIAISLPDRLDA